MKATCKSVRVFVGAAIPAEIDPCGREPPRRHFPPLLAQQIKQLSIARLTRRFPVNCNRIRRPVAVCWSAAVTHEVPS